MGGEESAVGRARLTEEIRTLRARRQQLVDELRRSDTPGDRGDAAQELQGGDELVAIDDRIAELAGLLAGGQPDVGGLAPGTEVSLRLPDGTTQDFRVVAIPEEIPPGAEDASLTSDSPLGLALAGSHPGETVDFPAPEGKTRVEVISIRPPS
ncbi:GreA/GreB family elongation factor [Saccharopolyspora spinosa]|uniref:Transcription elongation GreA/GreB family factor n=1 Tax=Saccharopolyspora spinosa TaxID=60894 RepID=A0A2N3XWK1_SACSN|nr:GreA/GreB family elongation factor [Saccharopolyspora spinosa]PKW15054.1 transcription elongation GreA/GreB family factor [Saccharopolyspora spinosa]